MASIALFVASDQGATAEVMSDLSRRHNLEEESPRRVTRTWLDTFDRRLYRAGWLLEHTTGDEACLTLTDRSRGSRQRHPWAGPRPGDATALPAPIFARVGEIVAERALLAVAELGAVVRESRITNGEGKTVARVLFESRCLREPEKCELPTLLTVLPVRGYEAQGESVASRLERSERLSPGGPDPLADGLRRIGRDPGMDPSRLGIPLIPGEPADVAVRSVLTRLLDIMEVNLDGVIRALDPEFLHDLRVAVRRSRSAVKLLGDALPPEDAEHFGAELKWLGDLTTPARDLDVYLMKLVPSTAELVTDGLGPFREFLASRRTEAQTALVAGLTSARFTRFSESWRAALSREGGPRGERADVPIGVLSEERIRRAYRRVSRLGAAIDESSPAEALHDLRKRCKELRYLLELFSSLHDPDRQRRLVSELKKLQDCLGEFQDAQIQRDAVGEFASQMLAAQSGSAEVLLAMGRLSRTLEDQQAHARSEFAARFAGFVRPANTRRVAELTSGT